MNEEIILYCEEAKEKMEKAILHLSNELLKLRAGKASPQVVDGICIDFYGVNTPLNQAANINTPDARTITIQPWDKAAFGAVEKAILKSDLGLPPNNDGKLIRLNFPPLNEERRKALVKTAKATAEQIKVAIRNVRREAMDELKKMQKSGDISEDQQKDAEAEIQKLTDSFSIEVGTLSDAKEKEIMEI